MLKSQRLRQAQALASNLKHTQELTQIGCSEGQLAAVATWLRDIDENFHALWRYAGFDGPPMLDAYQWVESEFQAGAFYICTSDAEEIPQPAAEIETLMIAQGLAIPKDWTVLDGPAGQSWLIINEDRDRTTGPDPFVKRPMKFGAFFQGVVVRFDGWRITRRDIVAYTCYGRGRTHSVATSYEKTESRKRDVLDSLDAAEMFFKRPNVSYVLLSIARDIAASEDVKRFVTKIDELS